MNGPTMSPKPLVPITESLISRLCATVSPWLVVSVATSSKALPIRTLVVKPDPTRPAADAKLLLRWDAAAGNKLLNDGMIRPRRTTKKPPANLSKRQYVGERRKVVILGHEFYRFYRSSLQ